MSVADVVKESYGPEHLTEKGLDQTNRKASILVLFEHIVKALA
jgi:hypothetical protein